MSAKRPAPIDAGERERAIVGLLDDWPWEHGGVVIGGYAVAAYGRPRYSDDLDVVTPAKGLTPTAEWLKAQDPPFKPKRASLEWTQSSSTATRLVRDDATVDLLGGAVRDRDAQVDISYDWIARDARMVRLVLLEASTTQEVPVVRPEAFWALKLQSGRPHDLGDLFAIRGVTVNLDEVRQLFEKLWCPTLQAKLVAVLRKLGESKQYDDSLSRIGAGSPSLPKNKKAWAAYTNQVRGALPPKVSHTKSA